MIAIKNLNNIYKDFVEIIKLIPNPILRFTSRLLIITTIVILIVELLQNFQYIPMFFKEFTWKNLQLFQFDLDFWGFAFGLSTFVIGLVITAHLDNKQNEDDLKVQEITNNIKEATKELLENQRQNHNSYIEVLEKAEKIVMNSDSLKIMTFTTTLGTIYSKDINELNLIYNKQPDEKNPIEKPFIDLSLPEHRVAKEELEKVIETESRNSGSKFLPNPKSG